MARISKVTPENGKPNLIGTMKKKLSCSLLRKFPGEIQFQSQKWVEFLFEKTIVLIFFLQDINFHNKVQIF